jgi:uncharacterized protein YndB with AHSA1/START domain
MLQFPPEENRLASSKTADRMQKDAAAAADSMMDIDNGAPVKARHEITVNAPARTIWRLLTEIEAWHRWNTAVTRSQLTGRLERGNNFAWKAGGISLTSTLQNIEPERHISWTGTALGIHAIHTWTLMPTAVGVTVKTAESFNGWPARLFSRALQKTLDSTLQKWLRDLKRAAEAAG